jgi:hypothetical protein
MMPPGEEENWSIPPLAHNTHNHNIVRVRFTAIDVLEQSAEAEITSGFESQVTVTVGLPHNAHGKDHARLILCGS